MSFPGPLPPGQNYGGHTPQQPGLSSPISQPYGQHPQMYQSPQYQQPQAQYQQMMFGHRPQQTNDVMPPQFNGQFMNIDSQMYQCDPQQFQPRYLGQSLPQQIPTTHHQNSFDARQYSNSPQTGLSQDYNVNSSVRANMGSNMGMYQQQLSPQLQQPIHQSQHAQQHQPLPSLAQLQQPLQPRPQMSNHQTPHNYGQSPQQMQQTHHVPQSPQQQRLPNQYSQSPTQYQHQQLSMTPAPPRHELSPQRHYSQQSYGSSQDMYNSANTMVAQQHLPPQQQQHHTQLAFSSSPKMETPMVPSAQMQTPTVTTAQLQLSEELPVQAPPQVQPTTLNPMDLQFVNPSETFTMSNSWDDEMFKPEPPPVEQKPSTSNYSSSDLVSTTPIPPPIIPMGANPHAPPAHPTKAQQPPKTAKLQKARKRYIAPESTTNIQPPPPPSLPLIQPPKTPVMSQPQTPTTTHNQHGNRTKSHPTIQPPSMVAPRTPSVTSPALSVRSNISKRSPSVTARSRISDQISLYGCVAEECLAAAHASIPSIIVAETDGPIRDFQKLMATGLACMEATMQSGRMTPRQEAKLRLRYAQLLYENTDNVMEAEMTLSKGLTLCERHRFLDLQYVMKYQLLKILFHRSPKAALVAADRDISDANATRHHQWVYAFRFLKATFYTQLGNPADVTAIENLRALGTTAQAKGDHAVCALAQLLEALALLKATKQENLERIQECLASATKHHLSQPNQLLQINVLIMMVDLACSMHLKQTQALMNKLSTLQLLMDRMRISGEWAGNSSALHVPIHKQGSTSHISQDTAAIISSGEEQDFISFSFVSRIELTILIMTYSGIAVGYQPSANTPKCLQYWKEAMETLDRWESEGITDVQPLPTLHESMRRSLWRTQIRSYLLVISGLFAATHCRWAPVKETLQKLDGLMKPGGQTLMDLMGAYLRGVVYMGTGQLDKALEVFSQPHFKIQASTGTRSTQLDVEILATLNRIWILQHPDYSPAAEVGSLLEELEPICQAHPDVEIQTVYNLVVSTIVTDPPQSLNQIKTSMHASIGGAKATYNKQCLSIALNVMRSKLFEFVMGEQALKSSKAASTQAKKGGSLVWMSVADGMLAQSHEVMGETAESEAAKMQGVAYAKRALGHTLQ